MFEIFVGIIALAGFLSFINAKFLKLPETIGVMILSIAVSLLLAASYFIDESYFENVTTKEGIDRYLEGIINED